MPNKSNNKSNKDRNSINDNNFETTKRVGFGMEDLNQYLIRKDFNQSNRDEENHTY
ncbi:hypothetical protein EDC18_1203 [Natranaerovirga pectinivora]|uniref:Uncharacterized protein n=1 Tax=Natranaerovirga pectinivora TaxID=682400 RepID=A0A4R3MGW8_9FIRM|nr:hypothetical protein [Natranaerovirga pectinivora]TCT11609.1 hypothetical protein EDC18_1203 [Natranaerovirga pectinivora]